METSRHTGTTKTPTAPTTILLIEDSPSDVRLVEELLRQASPGSFTIIAASTLAEGLKRLSANSVDLLLLDLGLPDSQGIATLRAIRKHASHLPIVVLTVSDDETLGERALQEGAQRFLSKDALTLGAPYVGVFTRMIRFAIAQARAETALVESEGHFHSLFNSSAIAQIYYDATGYPIRANAATLALFGIADVSALQHMTIFSSPRMSDDDKARLRGGEPVEYEQEYDFDAIKASGGFETTNSGTRHVHIFFTPLHNSQTGGIDGYLGQITEITERVRAERLLREAHQNVQALNEALRVANEELEQRVQERTAKLSETAARLKEEVSTRQQAEAAVKHRANELKVINDIMMIGSTAHDLPSLLSSILTKTLDFTDLEVGHVRLLHNDTLVLECAHGLPPEYVEEQREISIHDPLFASLLRTGKPRFEEDFESVEPVRASTSSLQTAGAVPLMAGKEMIGVIGVGSQQRRHLSKEQKELLGLIGREAGTVVAKMRAEESVKEHARRQDILTQVITAGNKASDLETACAAMLDTAMGLIPATAGIISLLNEAADATELQYSRGLTDEVREKARRLPLTNPNFVDVYHGKPLFMDDYTQQGTEQFRPLLPHLRITALVPLVEQSRVIGHYTLSSEGTQPFTEEERALLVAIGQQAGTVIARLQAETQIREYSQHLEDLVEERTAQLAQSEEYFRTLFDASKIAQARYDASGHPMRINTAAAELLGVSTVTDIEHVSLWSSPRIPEESKARLRAGHAAQFELKYDFRAIREGGIWQSTRSDVRYIEFYLQPLFGTSGNDVEGYLGQLVDITERKQAEAALQASEEQYRTLVETANNLIFTLDTEGTITFANDYGAHSLGYTPDELIGQNVMIIVPETESSGREMAPYINDIIAHPDEHTVSVNQNITKDGQRRWFNWVNKTLTDKEGHHIGHLAIGYDITEQIRAEEALRQAERLASIGETAAMIGHDLRNPLQGLQYIVDLQKLRFERMAAKERGTEDWQKEEALFDRISDQIFYMDKIVGDLQDYARPMELDHEEITIRTVIDDVLQAIPLADGVETIINVSDLTFVVDPHLMIRVFSNLILNALQAMPAGGTLTIGAEATDGSVAICVSDTGVGIPTGMRDKIFSPLTTGKAKGTGLGLAVVKRIVEAHNGKIVFESEVGKGTTFIVTLPRADG